MAGSIFDALTPPGDDSANSHGASMMDLVGLPEIERQLVTWMLREGQVTLAEANERLGIGLAESEKLLQGLEARGYVEAVAETGPPSFRPRRPMKRASRAGSSLWRALDDRAKP
ncbi:MAG: hypothetical protein ACYDAG_09970 [Chloroflexota bacterium]